MRFLSIGHVSRDRTRRGWRPGGSAYYAAAAAARLGAEATIVTRIGPAEAGVFSERCASLGIRLLALGSPVTTGYEARRDGGWRMTARAAELPGEEVAAALARAGEPLPARFDAVVLGSIAREFAPEVVGALAGGVRVLIAQGFLRAWDARGRIGPRPWAEADAFLPLVDAVVLSEEDIAGQEASVPRWSRAATVVVTRAERGARVWRNGDAVEVAGWPRDVVDPVGAGDTFAAALAVALAEGRPVAEAAAFACAAASFTVEGAAVAARADRTAVEHRLAERAGVREGAAGR